MAHSSKFKDLDTFFTEMQDVSHKDASLAVLENGYEDIQSRKKKISERIQYIQKNIKTDKMALSVESRRFIEKTLHLIEAEFKKSLLLLEENIEKLMSQKLSSLKKYEAELENELLRMNVVSNRRNSQIALKKLSSSEIKAKSLKETIECMLFSAEGQSRSNEIRDLQLDKEGDNDLNSFNLIKKSLDESLYQKMQEKTLGYINEMNFLVKEIGQVILYFIENTLN